MVVVAGITGCATSRPPRQTITPALAGLDLEPVETEIEKEFVRGLVSLKLGDYEQAREAISHVVESCHASTIGAQALLALAAIELDPRNPDRDPATARGLAERYLSLSAKPAWTEPAIETLYLLAVDLGGGTESEPIEGKAVAEPAPGYAPTEVGLGGVPTGCEPSSDVPMVGTLLAPALTGEPVVDRLAGLERDRVRLRQQVARLERQLAELERELKRIRETLKP